jgi:hypothetical protein
VWDLLRDDQPLENLVRLAQLLSSHQIDATGGMAAVMPETPRSVWPILRSRYPADFRSSPSQVLAWHHRKAEALIGPMPVKVVR